MRLFVLSLCAQIAISSETELFMLDNKHRKQMRRHIYADGGKKVYAKILASAL